MQGLRKRERRKRTIYPDEDAMDFCSESEQLVVWGTILIRFQSEERKEF